MKINKGDRHLDCIGFGFPNARNVTININYSILSNPHTYIDVESRVILLQINGRPCYFSVPDSFFVTLSESSIRMRFQHLLYSKKNNITNTHQNIIVCRGVVKK